MARGARSARGEIVDFDLLRIKENLGAVPKASTVKAREDFIDSKFKRRLRKMTEAVVARPSATPEQVEVEQPAAIVEAPAQDEPQVDATPVKKKIIQTSE